MLPAEIIYELCETIDTSSLVTLSQTTQQWQTAILDHHFQIVLQRECPWYELSNSPRQNWRDCAIAYRNRELRFPNRSEDLAKGYSVDDGVDRDASFVEHQWPIYKDQPLPPNLHIIGQLGKRGKHKSKLHYDNTTFYHGGIALKLTELQEQQHGHSHSSLLTEIFLSLDSSESSTDPIRISSNDHSDSVVSTTNIRMKMTAPRHTKSSFRYSSSVLAEVFWQGGVLTVKYRGSSGILPDTEISLPERLDQLESWLYVVGAQVYLLTNPNLSVYIYVVIGSILKLIYRQTNEPCGRGFVSYDGEVWEVKFSGFHAPGKRHSAIVGAYQDSTMTRYVILKSRKGVIVGLADLETSLRMIMYRYSELYGVLIMVGMSGGKMGVWTFSPEYLRQQMLKQHGVQKLKQSYLSDAGSLEKIFLPCKGW